MNAALANGLAITWNELDDGYTRTAVHPGALKSASYFGSSYKQTI
jgi:2-methylcitrate dehydratase PrpD